MTKTPVDQHTVEHLSRELNDRQDSDLDEQEEEEDWQVL
jgi:hypothetical protein